MMKNSNGAKFQRLMPATPQLQKSPISFGGPPFRGPAVAHQRNQSRPRPTPFMPNNWVSRGSSPFDQDLAEGPPNFAKSVSVKK